jgi:hypothetical protein
MSQLVISQLLLGSFTIVIPSASEPVYTTSHFQLNSTHIQKGLIVTDVHQMCLMLQLKSYALQ